MAGNPYLNALGESYTKSAHVERVFAWMVSQHTSKALPIFLLKVSGRNDVAQCSPTTKTPSDLTESIKDRPRAECVDAFGKVCLALSFCPPVWYLARSDGSVPSEFRENQAKGSNLFGREALQRFDEIRTLLEAGRYDALAKGDTLLSKAQWRAIGDELERARAAALEGSRRKEELDRIDKEAESLEFLRSELKTKRNALFVKAKKLKSNYSKQKAAGRGREKLADVQDKLEYAIEKAKRCSAKIDEIREQISQSKQRAAAMRQADGGDHMQLLPDDMPPLGDPLKADVFICELVYKSAVRSAPPVKMFQKSLHRYNNKLQNTILKTLQDLNQCKDRPARYKKALLGVRDLTCGPVSTRINVQEAKQFCADKSQLFVESPATADDQGPDFLCNFPKLPVRNLIFSNQKLAEEAQKREREAENKKKRKDGKKKKKKKKEKEEEDNNNQKENPECEEVESVSDGDFDALLEDLDGGGDDRGKDNKEATAPQPTERGAKGRKRKRDEKAEPAQLQPPDKKKKKEEGEDSKNKDRNLGSHRSHGAIGSIFCTVFFNAPSEVNLRAQKPTRKRERQETARAGDTNKRAKQASGKTARKPEPPVKDPNVSFEAFYESVLAHYGYENPLDIVDIPENGQQVDEIETARLAVQDDDFHRMVHEPHPKLLETATRSERQTLWGACKHPESPTIISPRALLDCAYTASHAARIPRSFAAAKINHSKVTEESYEDAIVNLLHSNEADGVLSIATAFLQLHDSINITAHFLGNPQKPFQLADACAS